MAYSPVQPLLDGDAVFSQYIASPPKQQLQIRIPPNTPHFTRPMRRELSYDFLSSSPPSPAGSVSSSSMVASASSSSVSSMTSNASFASYMSAGVPNTFPYNIGCHPCSPGHVLSHSPPMQPQGNTLPRTPSPSHQTNSEADITASGKRQRSSSSDIQSHLQSPTKRANASPGKRGSGKDGAEVWPEDVEGAFMEGEEGPRLPCWPTLTSFLISIFSSSCHSKARSPQSHDQRQTLWPQRAHCRLHSSQDFQSQISQASLQSYPSSKKPPKKRC